MTVAWLMAVGIAIGLLAMGGGLAQKAAFTMTLGMVIVGLVAMLLQFQAKDGDEERDE